MGNIVAALMTGMFAAASAYYLSGVGWHVPAVVKRLGVSADLWVARKLSLLEGYRDSASWSRQTFIFCAVCAISGQIFVGSFYVSAILFITCAAFRVMWLEVCICSRRRELEKFLPITLEMTALLLEAGADFHSAMRRLASCGGITGCEMKIIVQALDAGASKSRAVSLLSARWGGIAILGSFARAVQRGERYGGRMADVLRGLAVQAREERLRRAEKMGATSSQKMLLPLVLFIMPPTFVVAFGPLVLRLLNGEFF